MVEGLVDGCEHNNGQQQKNYNSAGPTLAHAQIVDGRLGPYAERTEASRTHSAGSR